MPVVRHGGREGVVHVCLKSSYIWEYVHNMKVVENMHVKLAGGKNTNSSLHSIYWTLVMESYLSAMVNIMWRTCTVEWGPVKI